MYECYALSARVLFVTIKLGSESFDSAPNFLEQVLHIDAAVIFSDQVDNALVLAAILKRLVRLAAFPHEIFNK